MARDKTARKQHPAPVGRAAQAVPAQDVTPGTEARDLKSSRLTL